MFKLRLLLVSSVVAAFVVNAASCHSGSQGSEAGPPSGSNPDGSTSGNDAAVLPFTPDSPSTYVAKVKNLLVGLPPTDMEVKTVESDPSQFASLVNTWMTSTQPCAPSTTETCVTLYQTKMLRFFELAFQQTQVGESDFSNQLQPGQLQLDENAVTQPLMLQNQQEVFARTMLSFVTSNMPFNNAMKTQQYMMTTAMKSFYALLDAWQLDNDVEGITDYFKTSHPNVTIQVTATSQVPPSDSADPTNSNFMIWYDPTLKISGCSNSSLEYPAGANRLFEVLVGFYPMDTNGCTGTGSGQLQTNDFADWTMVNIGQAPTGTQPGGTATTSFFDVASLRTATQMTLVRPYVGYFTTPAFFANWQTNASNEMRVTMNQTLIVATGTAISVSDTTVPMVLPPPGLDATHATNAQCMTCHQHLDPTRSILSSTFSWYYGQQTDQPAIDNEGGPDAGWENQPGMFIFENVQSPVKTIYQLASILSTHPLVAPGWTQKLCYYFDSEACVTTDPEFNRLSKLFQGNNTYSWTDLVQAIVTSPITTHTASTITATTNGEVVAVSRRDHLCAALNARLGFADICGLDSTKVNVLPTGPLSIVPGLPSDGYGRGSAAPVLPNNPTLFFRAGTENFCEAIAQVVIDNKNPPAGATTWSSSDCNDTSCQPITDFVNIVAGIPPSDPRATPLYQALLSNFDQSQGDAGLSATDALQSTFTAACMAPSAISIGL